MSLNTPRCTGSLLLLAALALVVGAGCQPARPAAPPVPDYRPNYTFASAAPSPAKQDITIAIINPVVKSNLFGSDGAAMVKALPGALQDLITAKGMRYSGPFESREVMTFPDKRASDLGLYAEFEVDAGWQPQNVQQTQHVSAWSWGDDSLAVTCNASVFSSGKVSFVVIEPMSGETVWRKTVPIEVPPVMVTNLHVNGCLWSSQALLQQAGTPSTPGRVAPPVSSQTIEGELGNAYRRQLELTFLATMKGIDTYMSAEEFATLKAQSQELKSRKTY